MSDPTTPFYDRLADDYPVLIRALAPPYEAFLGALVEGVAAAEPARIVEVGCGVGELSAALLERLPHARLTALDASEPMVAAARQRLAPFGSRARVVRADVRRFHVDDGCEAVVTSLVLHNLSPAARDGVLSEILGWLRPGCPFLWGDFVRLDDPRLRAAAHEERRAFALARGCDPDVVAENFRKEVEDDSPASVAEMLSSAAAVGFAPVDVVWADGAFAVLHARAPAF